MERRDTRSHKRGGGGSPGRGDGKSGTQPQPSLPGSQERPPLLSSRKKPREGRMDGVPDTVDKSLSQFREMMKDREAWRAAGCGVTELGATGRPNNSNSVDGLTSQAAQGARLSGVQPSPEVRSRGQAVCQRCPWREPVVSARAPCGGPGLRAGPCPPPGALQPEAIARCARGQGCPPSACAPLREPQPAPL